MPKRHRLKADPRRDPPPLPPVRFSRAQNYAPGGPRNRRRLAPWLDLHATPFAWVRLGLVILLATPQLSLFAVPLCVAHADAPPSAQPAVREIEIVVKQGYQPGRIEVKQGERVRLKFVRKEYNNCTREVVFPKLDIRRELPTNKPVLIDLPELAPGEYEFHCGMKMVKGLLVVTAR